MTASHKTSYNNHRLYLKIHSDTTTLTYTFPTDSLTIEQIGYKYADLDSIWLNIAGEGTDDDQ